jgi:hypothetical protein
VAATTAEPPPQALVEARRDAAIPPPTSVVASTALETESRSQLPMSESVSTVPATPPVSQPPQAAPRADPIMQAAVLPPADSQTGGWRRTHPDRWRDRRFIVLADIIRGPALVLSRLGRGALRSTSSHSASGVLEPK